MDNKAFLKGAWLRHVTRFFLPRDSIHKRGICRRRVSVCVSVCVYPSQLECDRHRHTQTYDYGIAYTALSVASHGKNR